MKKLFLLAVLFTSLCSCNPQQDKPVTPEVNNQEVVVENILARRSIRNYTDQQVTQDQLDILVECAINAPSANNRQPWEVRIIRNADLLSKFTAINERAIFNAPTVIVIANDTQNRWSPFDCGLLTQNILLAAESMDLGTCVVGSVPNVLKNEEAKELLESLNLPEGYEPIIGICLGNKNERPDAKPRDAEKVKFID